MSAHTEPNRSDSGAQEDASREDMIHAPWRYVARTATYKVQVRSAQGHRIALPVTEEQGRLIAAAPDMLAVLQTFVAVAVAQGLHLGPIIADAEAAIAKATRQDETDGRAG